MGEQTSLRDRIAAKSAPRRDSLAQDRGKTAQERRLAALEAEVAELKAGKAGSPPMKPEDQNLPPTKPEEGSPSGNGSSGDSEKPPDRSQGPKKVEADPHKPTKEERNRERLKGKPGRFWV